MTAIVGGEGSPGGVPAGTLVGSEPAGRPLRRDAERNLERIMEAAESLFAAYGYQTSMEEVAQRAGVGVGTLYRRFQSKEDLCAAVAERSRHRTRALARRILEEDPPGEGIFHFLRECLKMPSTWRPLSGRGAWHGEDPSIVLSRLAPMIRRLLERARDAGTIRPEVAYGDVVMVILSARAVADLCARVAPGVPERHLEVLLNGLGPGGRLPGQPATMAELGAVLSGSTRAPTRTQGET
jgi:AcrR family transcriptional regulator